LIFEGQTYNRTEEGVSTVGFIPMKYSKKRLELAIKFSDMLCEMGVKSISSYVGFIPNDPKIPLYL